MIKADVKPLSFFPILFATLFVAEFAIAETNQSQRLKKLRGEIQELRQDLKSDKKEKSQIFLELKQADKQIARISRALRDTNKRLKKQRKRYHQVQAKIKSLNESLLTQKDGLSQHMRAGYSTGQQPALKLLLNQDDPAQTGRTLTYYRYFTEAQLQSIADTKTKMAELAVAEEELRQETIKLTELKQEQESQQQAFLNTKKERKVVLAELNKRIQTKEEKLQHLVENEKRLTALLIDLEKKAAENIFQGKNLGQLKKKLKWPTKGKMLHRFGTTRNHGNLKWQGVVISGKEGQDIHAIAPGRVVFADWLRGYGLTLIIDHGQGYMSIYSHNQSLYKDQYDEVDGRELVASLGSSGGNSQQGLYFEIRYKGRPVNPARWCR